MPPPLPLAAMRGLALGWLALSASVPAAAQATWLPHDEAPQWLTRSGPPAGPPDRRAAPAGEWIQWVALPLRPAQGVVLHLRAAGGGHGLRALALDAQPPAPMRLALELPVDEVQQDGQTLWTLRVALTEDSEPGPVYLRLSLRHNGGGAPVSMAAWSQRTDLHAPPGLTPPSGRPGAASAVNPTAAAVVAPPGPLSSRPTDTATPVDRPAVVRLRLGSGVGSPPPAQEPPR